MMPTRSAEKAGGEKGDELRKAGKFKGELGKGSSISKEVRGKKWTVGNAKAKGMRGENLVSSTGLPRERGNGGRRGESREH